jgi:branched-chain amino acid aminotransferase
VHLAIAAWAWPSYFAANRMEGIRLAMAEWRRPAPDTAPTSAKATGLYMIGTLSKQKAEAAGYADALMLDWRGRVAEATGANVFFVMDGELHTPDPDCFLDGITRRTVVRLAEKQQMKVITRPIDPEEIGRASEVFLAGTAAEVTAVREIGAHRFTPGRVTETLMRSYDALVRQGAEDVRHALA